MPSAVQFCVVDNSEGSRLGRLKVPHRKVADWINFLISPRQQVQIVLAESLRGSILIHFQASESLYTYLETQISRKTATTAKTADQPLDSQVAS